MIEMPHFFISNRNYWFIWNREDSCPTSKEQGFYTFSNFGVSTTVGRIPRPKHSRNLTNTVFYDLLLIWRKPKLAVHQMNLHVQHMQATMTCMTKKVISLTSTRQVLMFGGEPELYPNFKWHILYRCVCALCMYIWSGCELSVFWSFFPLSLIHVSNRYVLLFGLKAHTVWSRIFRVLAPASFHWDSYDTPQSPG